MCTAVNCVRECSGGVRDLQCTQCITALFSGKCSALCCTAYSAAQQHSVKSTMYCVVQRVVQQRTFQWKCVVHCTAYSAAQQYSLYHGLAPFKRLALWIFTMHRYLSLWSKYVYRTLVMSYGSSCPFSSYCNIIFSFYGTFVVTLNCNTNNVP